MKRLFTMLQRFWAGISEIDSRTACRPSENPTRK
ncbi:hypothetical protein AMOR_01120 [Anaeromyxobacter oryzae]|uniref:Uncharacterized protein n=1 Tax=Anaeromyxobacter oryzae TaxID=2918170 RepID=A0ABM7WNT3_9BACT|nr:hypothetical protein AMOR_01120 [Anaeromyxobacter oryzae]